MSNVVRFNRVTTEQIAEWTENPVTCLLYDLCEEEMNELSAAQGLDAFHPFDPQKTQETLANLNGAVDTFLRVLDSLQGEGLFDEEVSDEE